MNAYCHRAFDYKEKKAYCDALDDLAKAVQLDPEKVKAHRIRGDVHYLLGDLNSAINDYTTAIGISVSSATNEPDCADIYEARANAYLAKGEKDRAEKDFIKARELRAGATGK